MLVAAGNDGTDQDGDGKINPMSVTSPATAKNCICVGASENERPNFNGEQYGLWWSKDYPVSPYRNAPMADDPEQVVAFSSRGPTEDGRIRPDLVAPGTFVLSTRPSRIAANNNAWAAFPGSRKYFHMGGTSMATPLAAGAATLVRQFLRRDKGIANPSAALIKAALIAGSKRLPNIGAAGAVCDNAQGFGRLDLDGAVAPGLRIPDNDAQGIYHTLEMDRAGKVHELELQVDITHTYIGDLRVVLSVPSGKTIAVHERTGGNRDNLIRTFDTGATPSLSALIGESTKGEWTLSVSDHAGRDIGKLNAWGVRVRF